MGIAIRNRAWLVAGLILVSLAALPGLAGTLFWWVRTPGVGHPDVSWGAIGFASVIIGMMTIANVGLRWLRWHYLVRRAGVRLATRDSALFYTSTLPFILTPFSVGELIRALVLGRRNPSLRLHVAAVWLLERASDFLVMSALAWVFLNVWGFLAVAASVWLLVVLGIGAWWKGEGPGRRLHFAALVGLLVLTGIAWVLPGVALWSGAVMFGDAIPLTLTLGEFAKSTLVGQWFGSPGGAGITGSSLIGFLVQRGFQSDRAVWLIVLFRSGTLWFAVTGGICIALLFRRRLLGLLRSGAGVGHFDALAPGYAAELPQHIRERLVDRKCRLMRQHLERTGKLPPARGLDFGCGQGWYACEMASRGYSIDGVDLSTGQIAEARAFAAAAGIGVRLSPVVGTALPYEDNTFDFAYAINVLHHVPGEMARTKVFSEIVRTLKPGGVFFLHEMNTANVFFRFYVGYIYPLVRAIDEGVEEWIHPDRLPVVPGAGWQKDVGYFTFLPDFLPAGLTRGLAGVEQRLEQSSFRRWSAHYVACLVKDGSVRSRLDGMKDA